MKTSSVLKAWLFFVMMFVVAPIVSAQEIDDVEADMDTAISESDAAQSAEDYARKRDAEEKEKLGVAKKQAIETTAKAAVVKDASQKRLGEVEKNTTKTMAERRAYDHKTEAARKQIEMYEAKVKAAEDVLAKEQEGKRVAVANLTNAQNTLAAHKKKLVELEAARKKEVAAKNQATRQVASIAGNLPGKKIVMAKDCPIHPSMALASPHLRFLKKGEKIDLAKVGTDGWFHARGGKGKGFMHKTCK